MKDATQEQLEKERPEIDAIKCIDYCLGQLYKDKKIKIEDKVSGTCSYEELIGALLRAKDDIKKSVALQAEINSLESQLEEARKSAIPGNSVETSKKQKLEEAFNLCSRKQQDTFNKTYGSLESVSKGEINSAMKFCEDIVAKSIKAKSAPGKKK